MEIYPAIDLYQGKVVRLERGDYSKVTIYSGDPKQMASKWIDEGCRWLHVVDLEGARSGRIENWAALEGIVSLGEASVQFGGGVRSAEDVGRLVELGVERVILGTKALEPSFLEEVTETHAGRIALSLDLRGEEVQVEGWTKGARTSVFDLFPRLAGHSVECVIVTDIERDGTLSGLNLSKMSKVLKNSPFPVIFSGGVSALNDILLVASIGSDEGVGNLEGIIVGKALYEGKIDLKKAIEKVCGRSRS